MHYTVRYSGPRDKRFAEAIRDVWDFLGPRAAPKFREYLHTWARFIVSRGADFSARKKLREDLPRQMAWLGIRGLATRAMCRVVMAEAKHLSNMESTDAPT